MRRPSHAVLLVTLAALVPAWRALAYLWAHRLGLPLSDTLFRNLPIAVAVHNGTLAPSDMFAQYAGHIGFFSYALTAALTPFGWPVIVEPFVVWGLAGAFVALAVWLIAREDRPAALLVAVPFSALAFTLGARFNWHVSYSGIAWWVLNLWLLGGLAFAFGPRHPWKLPLLALFAACATFTHGQGFIIAWILIAGVWLAGYRRTVVLVGGIVLAASLTWLYIRVGGVSTGGDDGLLSTFDLLAMTGFILAYLGVPVAGTITVTATATGAAGLLLLIVNGTYLWRIGRARAVWLWWCVAAYPVLTGGLVGLARIGVYLEPWKETQYITATLTFWVAVIALGALALRATWSNGLRSLAWANISAAAVCAALFVPSTFAPTVPRTDFRYVNETCHWRLAFTQDVAATLDAGCQLIENPAELNVLAYYDLAMFANAPARNILPPEYAPGEPVVVAGPDGWATYHTARWLLDGIPISDIYHLPGAPLAEFQAYNVSLTVPNDLSAAPPPGEVFWWVAPEGTSPDADWAAGYTPQRQATATHSGVMFNTTRYIRSDER